mmetsp:Transcript_51223/g.124827  ORF Transcript_51223/g.124827 Transcript_51223/m.124827 type:complete len:93 (-) Transcript_51223:440-718(-)
MKAELGADIFGARGTKPLSRCAPFSPNAVTVFIGESEDDMVALGSITGCVRSSILMPCLRAPVPTDGAPTVEENPTNIACASEAAPATAAMR